MRYSELKRKLMEAGCYCYREGSNHEIWYSPITDKKFPLSRHNKQEAFEGTKKAIEKQSGVKI